MTCLPTAMRWTVSGLITSVTIVRSWRPYWGPRLSYPRRRFFDDDVQYGGAMGNHCIPDAGWYLFECCSSVRWLVDLSYRDVQVGWFLLGALRARADACKIGDAPNEP
eukprot:6719118-Pyramimonas_sp.AAC.1